MISTTRPASATKATSITAEFSNAQHTLLLSLLLHLVPGAAITIAFILLGPWINQYPRYQYALLPVEDPDGNTVMMSTLLLAAFAVLVVIVSGYRSLNRQTERSKLATITASKA